MSEIVYNVGKWQSLPILKFEKFGAFLGEQGNSVLLPQKQVPEKLSVGDVINVFLYKDSDDRLIATVHEPKITLGEIAPLRVKETTRIGAFLDWGLEKDLLLPFAQQTESVQEGLFYPVALYLDKSGRLAASMWIDKFIKGVNPDDMKKQRSLITMKTDAENVYVKIKRKGGMIPYDDKADAELIKKDFNLSKNAFKRAVGILYKARRIDLKEGEIVLL